MRAKLGASCFFLALCGQGSAQFAAQGVGKVSVAATNAVANAEWLEKFLPVYRDEDNCGENCACGTLGKVNVETEAKDVRPDPRPIIQVHDFLEGDREGRAKGFSLQTVSSPKKACNFSNGHICVVDRSTFWTVRCALLVLVT